jgi:hypothetical protein
MTRIISSLALALLVAARAYFVGHPNPCSGGSIPRNSADSQPALAAETAAAPRYFAIVYSYQDAENHVMMSHTFAQFVEVIGDDPARAHVETHTISWLPARFAESLRLSVVAVKGKNFSLDDTFEFARRLGTTVKHWEPVEIDSATYRAALAQIDKLNSGSIKYKMYNSSPDSVIGQSTAGVSHCIHAVGDVVGRVNTGIARGFDAGEIIHHHFAAHAKSTAAPDWVYVVAARADSVADRPVQLASANAE